MLKLSRRAGAQRGAFECPEEMPRALYELLCARGVQSAQEALDFISPGRAQLRDPFALRGMRQAAGAIKDCIGAGQPICVFGDYDVDGVSASAIMLGALERLGADARVYIPSRHEEGYGLNEEALREIARWAALLVTVDCGVSAVELVALARSLGLQVVVTDHHRPGPVLPECILVNPLVGDYPFPGLCGAGVAFKLAQALLGEAAFDMIDLAALATVADVVPLVDENRALVSLGLESINRSARPGIKALYDTAGLSGPVRSGNIAFQLAPRLNAGGRLSSARQALDLLRAQSYEQALPLAQALEEENARRRAITGQILADAERQLETGGFDFARRRVIVLAGDGWNVGVVGLAAARLTEKYALPTVLLKRDKDTLTGSCRSVPGVDIFESLSAVSEYLTRFGGHRQAAGVTLQDDKLDAFAQALDSYIARTADPDAFIPTAEYDLELTLDQLDSRLVKLLDKIQPTGFGNPEVVFMTQARVERARPVGREGAHLRLTLNDTRARMDGVYFGAGALAKSVADKPVRALYTPQFNTYQGITSVRLGVKKLVSAGHLDYCEALEREYRPLHQAFLTKRLYNREYPALKNAGETVKFCGWDAPFKSLAQSPRGTLVVFTSVNRLRQFLLNARDAALFDRFDLIAGRFAEDARCFNAVCLCPAGGVPAGYERVYLADTPAALWPELDGARALEKTDAVAEWLDDLPGKEDLRTLYRSVRALSARPCYARTIPGIIGALAEESSLSDTAIAAGLCVLGHMDLINYTTDPPALSLKPMKKCDPETCPLFNRLRALREWRR